MIPSRCHFLLCLPLLLAACEKQQEAKAPIRPVRTVTVRHSVILVVQIEHEIAEGRPVWEAVIDATTHRFRPILLTAAAAILGLIPIAPTVFWGPMAFAMMGGLAVATALTLVFLPALYVAWFGVREPNPNDAAA